jgi:hypothetical protein
MIEGAVGAGVTFAYRREAVHLACGRFFNESIGKSKVAMSGLEPPTHGL